MTDKEKIRAEVERYKNEIISDNEGTDYEMGFIAALESIETFIGNIPEEPISEDLVEEFVSYIKEKFGVRQEGNTLKTDGLYITPYDLLDIANHFVNWQKEQMMKDAIEYSLYDDGDFITIDHDFSNDGYMKGDKVELIIVKEAEK